MEEGKERFLIDCGMQTPLALMKAGYKATDIDHIYISHAHADHVGGLEYFAFLRYDWMRRPRSYKEGSYAPKLIANELLLKDLWDKTLRGGLESMEGFVATIETFFEPIPVAPNKSIEWQGWKIDLRQQIHIMSGSMIMPSFGISFSKPGHKSLYFVTDSQHCSPRQMEEFYKEADIIFQDCECTGVNFQFEEGQRVYIDDTHEAEPVAPWPTDEMEALELLARGIEGGPWSRFQFGSGVHANFAQLAGYPSANAIKLNDNIKSKMWLSHYQDFVLHDKDMYGNPVNWEEEAKKCGFAGFVKVGQEFEV